MTEEKFSTSYCPVCAEDFRVVISGDDDILIACECRVQKPEEFIKELSEQLPLPTNETFEKINKKKPDREGSKGFQ